MKKYLGLAIALLSNLFTVHAQELFTYTEPASNMAAKSIGIRMSNYVMNTASANRYSYHMMPELMWGISRKIMLHGTAFLSNRNGGLAGEGAGIYAKYRFLSEDEVHQHFRMAAYGRFSFNNSDVHQPAIDLNGHNSGYELGVVATQLRKRIAVSVIASHLHALDNGNKNKFFYGGQYRNAIGYSASIGKLMLPKEYVSYDQTNLNLMLEVLGQVNMQSGEMFTDLAPSLQLIIKSRMRIDMGYRFPMLKGLERSNDRGFLLRFEYNIFNAY